MANIAALLPTEAMLDMARRVAAEFSHSITLEYVTKENVVNQARAAVQRGASIIVARGLHAVLIKTYLRIPVIEIVLTGQELALLVKQAKRLVPRRRRPHIAFVGNAFSDMSHFEDLFGIRLSVFQYSSLEDHVEQIALAMAARPDVIIGGASAIQHAQKHGIPALFFDSTEESIREAFRAAKQAAYAADMEKHHTARMETILGAVTGGVLVIGPDRRIQTINHAAQEMLGLPPGVVGLRIDRCIDGLDAGDLDGLLAGREAGYQAVVSGPGDVDIALWCTPFGDEGTAAGAIVTCSLNARATAYKTIQTKYLQGYTAQQDFDSLVFASTAMRQRVEQAKLYAMSTSPVLILGPSGVEVDDFAQAIHRASLRRDGPYVTLHCAGIAPQDQERVLFGAAQPGSDDKGALAFATYGTLFLRDIDALTRPCQYRLHRALRYRTLTHSDAQPTLMMDTRVIASTSVEPAALLAEDMLCRDLYYMLASLSLTLPPLAQRPEDIRPYAETFIAAYGDRYHRQLDLPQDAWDRIAGHDWPGNITQLQGFCERLVLAALRARVTGATVAAFLKEMEGTEPTGAEDPADPQGEQLRRLLETHQGNRRAVAQQLGISTTTLWRRMKEHKLL